MTDGPAERAIRAAREGGRPSNVTISDPEMMARVEHCADSVGLPSETLLADALDGLLAEMRTVFDAGGDPGNVGARGYRVLDEYLTERGF